MASLISVLLPSRARPGLASESMKSLVENMSDINYEILLAVDPDDAHNYEHFQYMWVAPERWGYGQLHKYYNALAEQARGDWLLLWNDDALMETPEWDTTLRALPDSILVADLQSQHSPGLCCFPAVRKRAVEAVGGFSPHTPHCDTYWQDIGRETGTIQSVGIRVNHRRFDVSGENADVTYREGQSSYKTSEYYGPQVQSLIAQDIATIRRLV